MAFWWGAALQNTVNEPVWDSLLNVSLLASLDDLGTPVTALIDIDLGENNFDEDASIGSVVGIKLRADDPDAIDRVTYSVDDDRFVVDELGVVRTNANFYFEAEDSVTFTATASSTDGSTVDQSFTISIKDVVDQTTGTNGSDALFGQSGDDSILGWGGDDLIEASTGNDIADGQDGNDFIYGGAGDDTLSGGAGQDAILGGLGNDWINGGAGFDYIVSGSGNDQIFGGEGDDQIVAESGSNTLAGGQGTDILQSGMDDDYFEFSAGDGTDYIFGFDVAEDVLAFSGGITMADLDVSTFNNVTLVDYDGGTAILFDVTEASLNAQNFDFI